MSPSAKALTPATAAELVTKPRRASRAWRQVLPRQHGAWATLTSFFLLGLTATGDAPMRVALVALVVFPLFVLQYGVGRLGRFAPADPRRGPLLGPLAYLAATASVAAAAMWSLAPGFALLALGVVGALFGGTGILLERWRRDRTLYGELTGILGLSLQIPLIAISTGAPLDAAHLALWGTSSLYFVGSIARVRHHVRLRKRPPTGPLERLAAGAPGLAFHLAALGLSAALVASRLVTPLIVLAWLPTIALPAWTIARSRPPLTIRAVGWQEVAQTTFFVLVLGLGTALG